MGLLDTRRTDCLCNAKCGETHLSCCSDQNCLNPAGFIITCAKHRAKNHYKYRERIEDNIFRLKSYGT